MLRLRRRLLNFSSGLESLEAGQQVLARLIFCPPGQRQNRPLPPPQPGWLGTPAAGGTDSRHPALTVVLF
jgi:hypothetical protein